MKYRYFINSGTDPYENLALEELLLSQVKPNEYLLYLWQNAHTIVIGKNQNPYIECKVKEFIESGGKIARRHSGGGAVYHDLGNLNFTLMAGNEIFDRQKHYRLLLKTAAEFGIHAEFNGRNDLVINGKKFSGNAFFNNGTVSYQHGTLLIHSDLSQLKYLTPHQSKLKRNGISSVESRVINLTSLVPELTVKQFTDTLIRISGAESFSEMLDEKQIREKTDFYASEKWIFGRESD